MTRSEEKQHQKELNDMSARLAKVLSDDDSKKRPAKLSLKKTTEDREITTPHDATPADDGILVPTPPFVDDHGETKEEIERPGSPAVSAKCHLLWPTGCAGCER